MLFLLFFLSGRLRHVLLYSGVHWSGSVSRDFQLNVMFGALALQCGKCAAMERNRIYVKLSKSSYGGDILNFKKERDFRDQLHVRQSCTNSCWTAGTGIKI